MIEFQVEGVEEVRRKLRQLGDVGRASTLEGAIRAGAAPVVEAAKAKAPPGNIASSIQVVRVIVKDEGEIVGEIGIPGGKHKGYYGLWYELGTGPRAHKSGKSTGQMRRPFRPFLRPAADEQGDAAAAAFGREVKRALDAVADG